MVEATRYEIEHVTRFHYSAPVFRCAMALCLEPRRHAAQRLLGFELATDPASRINDEVDAFGNRRHVLNIHHQHQLLEVVARTQVALMPGATAPDPKDDDAWGEIRSWRDAIDLWDFTRASELARPSPALDDFMAKMGLLHPEGDPLQAVQHLSDVLHDCFDYVPGSTSVISPIEHILETGQGVCQDYVHVMITIARTWGIPTRYVSGYLHITGEDGEQAPRSATHAWVECLLPGYGWTGFDPTNRTCADSRHVRIAIGRDYRDVAPTTGVLQGGGDTHLEVQVRIHTDKENVESAS